MRVTNNMLASQTLFNVQRSLNKFLNIQEEMSTGRRVNRPSDDPIGVQRTITYRSALERIEQFRTNINLGTNLLSTYESSFADMNTIVQEVADVGLAVSDDSNNSPEAIPAFLDEVTSSIDRIVQLANVELDGRRILAGHRTDVAPLVMGPDGFTYVGDRGQMNVEIDDVTTIQLNMNAADVLLKEVSRIGAEGDVEVGIDGATPLSELNGGLGIDLNTFTVVDDNLGITVSVDTNLPTVPATVNDLLANINSQLSSSGVTNLTASIGSDSNIRFDATNNGLISATTPLSNLRGGSGIDLAPGTFRVTDGAGIDFQVDISSAVTVGDVITAINTQLAANGATGVTAAVNAAGTGIDIIDSNGTPLGLQFEDVGSQSTAANLGIAGAVNPTLNGANLDPMMSFTITEGAGNTATDLGIAGEIHVSLAGRNLNAILTNTTPISRLNNGLGLNLDTIRISQGGKSFIVDLGDPSIVTAGDIINAINNSGANVTAAINTSGAGFEIRNNSADESLIVENLGPQNTADKLNIYGASDLLGALVLMRNELSTNASSGGKVDPERIKAALNTLKLGSVHVLSARGAVGSKQIRLDATSVRLSASELETTKLLSEVEDADITELVTRLASHENNYRAGLIATSKIIQPSLMDFLR